MAHVTVAYGVILVVLGIVGYFGSGRVSATALIPAYIGAVVGVLGVLQQRENLRKHMAHAAVVLALIAFGGGVPGLSKLPAYFAGPERSPAVLARSIMALLSLVYIAVAVRSFIAARRARIQPTS